MKKIISGILTLSLAIILFANMEQNMEQKMSKPKKSNVVQTTQINNQSYVNCQGAPVAKKMWPGPFFIIHV